MLGITTYLSKTKTSNINNEMKRLTSAAAYAQFSPRVLATTCPDEVGRSQIKTFPPWRTILSAVARPRPEAPPVTRATRPCKVWRIINTAYKRIKINKWTTINYHTIEQLKDNIVIIYKTNANSRPT